MAWDTVPSDAVHALPRLRRAATLRTARPSPTCRARSTRRWPCSRSTATSSTTSTTTTTSATAFPLCARARLSVHPQRAGRARDRRRDCRRRGSAPE
eukprot:4374559-Prymnesium_polylepis.1